MNHHQLNIYEQICKKPHFTQNMNYYELRIYDQICKKISFQYHKTVTCNISVSESSTSAIQISTQLSDLPPEIEGKLSAISYENPKWHTDVNKQDPSTTSCKISQTQYLCLKP